MRLLAISGSLRRGSVNTAALAALAKLAPHAMEVRIYQGLAALPAFNPDDDEDGATPPAAVRELRAEVADADGIVIAAPEYAHGVPGALKNALDWLVASEAFAGKPVVLINCAPRAFHAQAALRETLATMAARLVGKSFASMPLAGAAASPDAILASEELSRRLRDCLNGFASAIREGPSP